MLAVRIELTSILPVHVPARAYLLLPNYHQNYISCLFAFGQEEVERKTATASETKDCGFQRGEAERSCMGM